MMIMLCARQKEVSLAVRCAAHSWTCSNHLILRRNLPRVLCGDIWGLRCSGEIYWLAGLGLVAAVAVALIKPGRLIWKSGSGGGGHRVIRAVACRSDPRSSKRGLRGG